MSILIKGMEMPTQCYDCYLVAMDYDNGNLYCKHLDKEIADWSDRLPNCPLVPVPPHGRLIDADALLKDGWTLHKYVLRMGGCALHEMPLNCPSLPTIIEAEGGDAE